MIPLVIILLLKKTTILFNIKVSSKYLLKYIYLYIITDYIFDLVFFF